ncbi:Sec62/63 complex, subunit Sec66, partial [Thamnocephalis sphaerospora]
MSMGLASGYVAGMAVAFGTFVYCYHKRKANVNRVVEGWFPEHTAREQYYDLLEQETPAAEAELKTTLMHRAVEDVRRIYELREKKPSLSSLVRSGQIGEAVWNQFQAAEAEMELELMEVVQEADRLKEGWGQQIFQTASEMVQHERQKEQQQEMEEMQREQQE